MAATAAGVEPVVPVPVGPAPFAPVPAEELLLFADKSLYAAKAAGRARVAWWDDGPIVGRSEHGLAPWPPERLARGL